MADSSVVAERVSAPSSEDAATNNSLARLDAGTRGKPPLVSIIVVSHNYAQFVGKAVASALGQSYRPLEVILVDDGSTDGSQQILAAFADRAEVILKRNGGETSTVNAGFAASTGDIVMLLDSDDMLHEAAAASVVAAWRPGISKVQYCLRVVDADDAPWGRNMPRYPEGFSATDVRRLVRRFGTYPAPPSSGNAYSRDFLSKVMPIDARQFPFAPDGALNAIAPLYGDVVSIDRPLGYYRVHGRNMWAMVTLDRARILQFIDLGRKEARFTRAHAIKRGIEPPRGSQLDHSFHLLERRLAA